MQHEGNSNINTCILFMQRFKVHHVRERMHEAELWDAAPACWVAF